MNKNSLLAFLLMAVAVFFFSSSLWDNFWYKTILRKPVPVRQASRQQQPAGQTPADIVDTGAVPPQERLSAQSSDTDAGMSGVGISEADTVGGVVDSVEAETAAAPPPTEDTVIVETNRLIAAISTKGARIVSLKMKNYPYSAGRRKGELIDLIPAGSVGGAQLSVGNESFDDVFFTVSVDEKTAVFEAVSSSGKPVWKKFTFEDDTYKVGYTVGGGGIVNNRLTLGWAGGIEDSEAGAGMPFGGGIDKRRAHYFDGRSVGHFEMKKKDDRGPTPSGVFSWVGMSSKYFFLAIVAPDTADADIRIKGFPVGTSGNKMQDFNYSIYYEAQTLSPEMENWIYAGPNGIKELSSHKLKFEKALFPVLSWARHIFWADAWFPPLAEFILKVLLFLYNVVKDYGLAIFLLTLLSKVITFPMTQSSTKSMMKMRDLQPKLKAIQEKHKGNPQKLNQEVMALYKTEGINPFNPGCLPMFLQMPIFIALFVALRKAIELRGATTFLLPWVKDLSLPEALFYLPFSLPMYGNNVALMPILMAALTFFQQKQTITDPNQKMMIYMMPVLMLVMFNGFPAGVVFYWTVSSALGLVQQMWLKPKNAAQAGAATATVTTSSGTQKVPVKKSGGSGPGSSPGGKRKRK